MQPEASHEGDDHVAEGGGGHDEGEIGPAERRGVAGEEADEENDSGVDEGVEEGVPEEREVMQTTAPTWPMPRERRESPTDAVNMMAMRTAYCEGFRACFKGSLSGGRFERSKRERRSRNAPPL